MTGFLLAAQFHHVAQDRDAPPIADGHVFQQIERCEHRCRAGVIGVIQQRCTVDPVDYHQPQLRADILQAGDDLLPVQTLHKAHGGGSQRRVDAVAAQQRHLDVYGLTLVMEAETDAVHSLADDLIGPEVTILGQAVHEHPRMRQPAHCSHQRLVGVEQRDAIRRQRLNELRLGLGHTLDGAHALQMHRANVGDNPDPGLGDSTQLGDFAQRIHPHFQHGPLVAVV